MLSPATLHAMSARRVNALVSTIVKGVNDSDVLLLPDSLSSGCTSSFDLSTRFESHGRPLGILFLGRFENSFDLLKTMMLL